MSSSPCQTLCNSWKEKLSYRSKTAIFLLDNLVSNGCEFDYSTFVRCTECEREIGGGFKVSSNTAGKPANTNNASNNDVKNSDPERPHIIVCSNRVRDYAEFEQVVTHELIHAIDQCRVKNPSWSNNRRQLACTEIRASNLSGECNVGTEFMRGNTRMKGGQIECVKRRAKLSLGMHGKGGEDAVEGVFDKCYKDTYPFMRHPKLN
mmetsp:Transcript_17270/g.35584  ORF Transcript_17270/g.35584 Transcript_17270/m.35584 type:complete len:206 (+) Transcript_17270:221-838(+)